MCLPAGGSERQPRKRAAVCRPARCAECANTSTPTSAKAWTSRSRLLLQDYRCFTSPDNSSSRQASHRTPISYRGASNGPRTCWRAPISHCRKLPSQQASRTRVTWHAISVRCSARPRESFAGRRDSHPRSRLDAEQLCRGAAEDRDLVVVTEVRGRQNVIDRDAVPREWVIGADHHFVRAGFGDQVPQSLGGEHDRVEIELTVLEVLGRLLLR